MTTLLSRALLPISLLLVGVGCGGSEGGGPANASATSAVTQNGESFRGRGGDRVAHMTRRFDANNDGALQLAEVPEGMRERLAAADANRDGVLASEEVRAHFEAQRAARFQSADADHDGALNAQEVGAERWTRLSRADANSDGRVTQEEMAQGFARMREGFGRGHHGPRGEGAEGEGNEGFGRGRHGMGRGLHRPDPARMVQRFDANGDGALQLAEVPERMRERLGSADANGDGTLAVDELNAAMERFRAAHPRGPMGEAPEAPTAPTTPAAQ